MAIHFCAHPWEVVDIEDGTLVALSNRDLTADAVAVLVDELYEIACESDQPNLCLDFERVGLVGSIIVAKMVVLDGQLREIGGRLRVINVSPTLYDLFQHLGLNDVITVQRR